MASTGGGKDQAAVVIIKRRNLVQDGAWSYTVFVDDKPVGKIRPYQTKAFQVSPGRHDVQLKMETGSCSDVFEITATPGSRHVFRTHWRGLRNSVSLQFGPPSRVREPEQGGSLLSNGYYEWPWIRMRPEVQKKG